MVEIEVGMPIFHAIKAKFRTFLRGLREPAATRALYKILYDQVHDLKQSREILSVSTRKSFSDQWSQHPDGEYLLSDPWFKKNVSRILSEQEILIKPDWFKGKKVLDAGCGNGRWAYGFCELGADLTCVDQAASALQATEKSTAHFTNPRRFIQSPLEQLGQSLKVAEFDLVFSWGVLHHCTSYLDALSNVASIVKEGGILYLYLYGRDSVPLEEDLELFKKRVVYNVLLNDDERYKFLLRMAKGDKNRVHNEHDIYAPLINRRLTFQEVAEQLDLLGFSQVTRTIQHTEIFVRAVKGQADLSDVSLPARNPPYWFQSHSI